MRYGWRPYVSSAQRQRKAAIEMNNLVKKGFEVNPVVIEGRTIAKTFWGKAWCENLESYSDYENRLPRGRMYVRNGSVCHLEIGKGKIEAKVSGSALYSVTINIKPLDDKTWKSIKDHCTGKIASLLELLSGALDTEVMKIVTDRQNGLFPKPNQISIKCSCPDWATMCKHVAAVLYGVGARLDEHPELLFLLRGVDHLDLVSAKIEDAVKAVVKNSSHKRIAVNDLTEVFGIELDVSTPVTSVNTKKGLIKPFPKKLTGKHILALRKRLGLNGKEFAKLLGVSGAAVSIWERSTVTLNLQDRNRKSLEKAWKKDLKRRKHQ